MTLKKYMSNIQAKSGKSPQDFRELAGKHGFAIDDKIVATHAQLLNWLESDIELDKGHANMVIPCLHPTTDPNVRVKKKDLAYSTGYQEVAKHATN